jgi:hypothetical protein
VARSVDELGWLARLLDSGFGRALDLKLVLFAGLVALGALNRYRILPLFRAGSRGGAAARLRRSVGAELGPGGGGAGRGGAAEPAGPGGGRRSGPGRAGGRAGPAGQWQPTGPPPSKVSLTVTPGAAGPNRFTATVADFDTGAALPVDRVELAGTPAAHPDLGTARLELTEGPDGRWLGQGRLLSLAGRWNLTTTIQRPAGRDRAPALDVPATGPLLIRANPECRHFPHLAPMKRDNSRHHWPDHLIAGEGGPAARKGSAEQRSAALLVSVHRAVSAVLHVMLVAFVTLSARVQHAAVRSKHWFATATAAAVAVQPCSALNGWMWLVQPEVDVVMAYRRSAPAGAPSAGLGRQRASFPS